MSLIVNNLNKKTRKSVENYMVELAFLYIL